MLYFQKLHALNFKIRDELCLIPCFTTEQLTKFDELWYSISTVGLIWNIHNVVGAVQNATST